MLTIGVFLSTLNWTHAQQPDTQGMILQGLLNAKNGDESGAIIEFEHAWLADSTFTQKRYKVASFYHKFGMKLMLNKQISASIIFFDRALRLINDEGFFIQSRSLAQKLKPMENRNSPTSSKKSMSLAGPHANQSLRTDDTSGRKMQLSSHDVVNFNNDVTLDIAIAFSRLASECEVAKDIKNAIAYYKDVLIIRPDMDIARMALEKLDITTE